MHVTYQIQHYDVCILFCPFTALHTHTNCIGSKPACLNLPASTCLFLFYFDRRVLAEYHQVTIGDGTVIGDGAFLLTHTVEARHVKVRPITIGKQVTIGALSAVLPDAAMEDYATLREMSLVSNTCVWRLHVAGNVGSTEQGSIGCCYV